MILFTILLLTLAFLTVFIVLTASAIGTISIIIFGDVIVCIVFMVLIIKHILFRRRR